MKKKYPVTLARYIEQAFYDDYETWESTFEKYRQVYEWPKGEPTSAQFRRAILSRIEWHEENFPDLDDFKLQELFDTAIEDLQHGRSGNFLMIKDADAYREHFGNL